MLLIESFMSWKLRFRRKSGKYDRESYTSSQRRNFKPWKMCAIIQNKKIISNFHHFLILFVTSKIQKYISNMTIFTLINAFKWIQIPLIIFIRLNETFNTKNIKNKNVKRVFFRRLDSIVPFSIFQFFICFKYRRSI